MWKAECRFAILWHWLICAVLTLVVIDAMPVLAAQTYVIRSGKSYLHLWSGPGTEYQVLASLPNGAKVMVHEHWGEWAKISSIEQPATEGWVLKRDLLAERQVAAKTFEPLNREQEQRRFGRLRRKGVLGVQRDRANGALRLSMNPLLWHRLPPLQQENFLRRAQQFFGAASVEIWDQRNATFMGRLTATGELEVPLVPPQSPEADDSTPMLSPATPNRSGLGQ
jgi:uncharacterized protein YgiM (DUF1202 family)